MKEEEHGLTDDEHANVGILAGHIYTDAYGWQ